MTGNDVDRLAFVFRRLTTTLYHRLSADQGNLFFSPHGIAAALLLIYAGARGNTRIEIETALEIDLPAERAHRAFSELTTAFADREIRDDFHDHDLEDFLDPQTSDSGTPVDTTDPERIRYRFISSAGL